MRWIVGGKAAQTRAASPSQMGRFETQWLVAPVNLSALADLSGRWIDLVRSRRPPRGIVLDMDSSVSPTHGDQENSGWNGHYGCTCYHPLFVFNQFGDLERCALRSGNVHSADSWESVLKPVVARCRGKISRIYFRADAAFAMPGVYEYLESERIKYAIRLPANEAEVAALSDPGEVTQSIARQFEVKGVDVVLTLTLSYERAGHIRNQIRFSVRPGDYSPYPTENLGIEIKPVVGDDYPAVLRQMNANGSKVLFLERYTGKGRRGSNSSKRWARRGAR